MSRNAVLRCVLALTIGGCRDAIVIRDTPDAVSLREIMRIGGPRDTLILFQFH